MKRTGETGLLRIVNKNGRFSCYYDDYRDKDLIKEFHFYPFPRKPYGYKTLLSFEFAKGELRKIEDFSETAQILRGLFEKARESGSSMLRFGSDFELYRMLPEEIKKDLWWYEKDAPYF